MEGNHVVIVNRKASGDTYDKMETLIHKIKRHASKTKDHQTYSFADSLQQLLLNFGGEIQMEDKKAGIEWSK